MTKVAWESKNDEIVKARPAAIRQKFVYNLSRASFEKEWGTEYERPGVFARFLAFLFRMIPKVGPFKALSFKSPSARCTKIIHGELQPDAGRIPPQNRRASAW